MHQDSFKSKPITKEYVNNYNKIDWSKPLGKVEPVTEETKDKVVDVIGDIDYRKNETIDIEEWLHNKIIEAENYKD